MKATALFLLLSLLPLLVSAQSGEDAGNAGRLLFAPLIAHHVEPRVGFSRLVDEERLRLDIGNSIDLLTYKDMLGADRFAVGADFFTWTSLRQEKDFHFPVDAVDYLFGINATWKKVIDASSTLSARLRLSHISAHLVDGSFDPTTDSWRHGVPSRVYSREFFDLVVAWEYDTWLRLYGGGQYVYHIDPADLGKLGLQGGFEAVWRDAAMSGTHLYAAYDLRMLDNGETRAAHGFQVGVKFGPWRGSGLNLFVALYDGPSQHGEYHDRRWSYWGPGMNIDF